ncbi:MAG: alpha/beta hydrolase fold domain-containing protein, partial [Lachnospiraceae bacterium]|nr:alpha/beta hydrolase fold domain-containing protein [Lachnospiraceae bacterium]
LAEYSEKQKKPLKIPYKKLEKQFDVLQKNIAGTTCYVVRLKSQAPKTAVLYLFGGGYILPPDPGDLILCGQIAANCNAEVWFPLYPMAPEHRLVETLQSTLRVYEEMLKAHAATDIRFFGTSSGGGQAMSLCVLRCGEADLEFSVRYGENIEVGKNLQFDLEKNGICCVEE